MSTLIAEPERAKTPRATARVPDPAPRPTATASAASTELVESCAVQRPCWAEAAWVLECCERGLVILLAIGLAYLVSAIVAVAMGWLDLIIC